MKIALINGSPKIIIKKQAPCASYTILQDAKRFLRRYHIHDMEDFHLKTWSLGDEERKELLACDTWLFSFPVYSAGIPSHLLRFMAESEQKIKTSGHAEIKVYAIANGGLYEGTESYPVFEMFANWCEASGLVWGGGLGVGGGPTHAGEPLSMFSFGRGRSYSRKLAALCEAAAAGIPVLNTVCQPDYPKKRYIAAANRNLRREGKANGLSALDLDRQP